MPASDAGGKGNSDPDQVEEIDSKLYISSNMIKICFNDSFGGSSTG